MAADDTSVSVTVSRSTGDRVRDIEIRQGVQENRLDDHDQVLRDLRDHLATLVERVDKFRWSIAFGCVVIFSGTPTGTKLFGLLGHLVGG